MDRKRSRATLLIALTLIPSTLVMLAINGGIIYLAWLVGPEYGIPITVFIVLFLVWVSILILREVRKHRLAKSESNGAST
jgi:hypothetical protein